MAHNPPSVTVRTYTKLNQYAASFNAGNITLGKFKELVFDAFAESGAFTSPAASMYNYMTGSGEGPSKTGVLAEGQWNLPNDYKVGSEVVEAAPVAPEPEPVSPNWFGAAPTASNWFGSAASTVSPNWFGSAASTVSPNWFGQPTRGASMMAQPATAASLRDAETQRIIDEMLRKDAARLRGIEASAVFGAPLNRPNFFVGTTPDAANWFGAPQRPAGGFSNWFNQQG